MRYRILLVFPLVLAPSLLIFDFVFHGSDGYQAYLWINRWLARGLAISGCLIPALAFRSGEYLRWAWLFIGACHILLMFRDVPGFLHLETSLFWTEAPGVLANLSYIVGIWLLARAWRVAGLELPGSKLTRRLIVSVVLVLALAIVGPMMFNNIRELYQGNLAGLTGISAGISDSFGFLLLAPLLLTALALRGGLLAWPWLLYSICQFLWLFLDAVFFGAEIFDVSPHSLQMASDLLRFLASAYVFSAGMAQRFVMKQIVHDKSS